MIERFEQMLAQGQDNALLRFSLGQAYLQQGNAAQAVIHLRAAVAHDPEYSAAWKSLGKALSEAGQAQDACAAYQQGIAVAERKGDKQASKEMQVFLRRLQRSTSS